MQKYEKDRVVYYIGASLMNIVIIFVDIYHRLLMKVVSQCIFVYV